MNKTLTREEVAEINLRRNYIVTPDLLRRNDNSEELINE